MYKIIFNDELNGVELYFDNKPDQDILSNLKVAGFRWHKYKKCWYAKQNQRSMEIASKVVGKEISPSSCDNKTTKSKILPTYDCVGKDKIFEKSDVSIISNKHGYYYDINAHIYIYERTIYILDLTNAMKIGKECNKITIYNKDYGKDICDFYNTLVSMGINEAGKLYEYVKNNGDFDTDLFNVSRGTIKSSKVFSPFVKVNPISVPPKWTKAHLWKAILSGQVFKGETNYHYTDDYAYDTAYNYREGMGVNLEDLARDLIEDSCGGYTIYSEEEKDGVIPISLHTYSYDCKTLYFDEKGNYETKQRRLDNIQKELEEYNKSLEEKVLNLSPNDLDQNCLYEIEYITKDCNTGRYQVEKEIVHTDNIFYENECTREIISLNKYHIDTSSFYTIERSQKNDKRIIDIGMRNIYITGKALLEMLSEGIYVSRVSKSNTTYELLKEECEKHIEGRVMYLFGEDKTDWNKSLLTLNMEYLRTEDDTCLAQ